MRRTRSRVAAALLAQAPLDDGNGQMLMPIEDLLQNRTGRNTSAHRSAPTGSKRANPRSTPQKPLRRLLAIDPGTRSCGWAVLDAEADSLEDSGTIRTTGKALGDRLPALRDAFARLVQGVDLIAYELPFRAGNRGDQALPQVVALLQLAAADAGIPIRAIALPTARKVACGYGSAAKEDVAELMRFKYGRELRARGRDWESHDESDAVCIGAAAVIMTREGNGAPVQRRRRNTR